MVACPIESDQVDENVARVTGAIVVAGATLYAFTGWAWIAPIMCGDFFLRGFLKGKASPLGFAAKFIATRLKLPKERINAGPKRFAARLGFLMTAAMVAAHFGHQHLAASAFAIMLAACAFLEAAFGYCIACKIYGFVLPRLQNQTPTTSGTPSTFP